MDIVEKCMIIIANSGNGKSLAIKAIKEARSGNFDEAEADLKRAEEAITIAHQAHSEILFYNAEHKDLKVDTFLIHAANHLTSAGVVKDLAEEIVYLHKIVQEKENKGSQ
ncbi:PTS lactose/cellobiose transporter subunit IIA [Tepidanaerobacter syntrophicus]|uniref:PTS lactose/cellobiose transporter subunit IIA n=1 Tax=Tepidanaerobacter syntrophicus TaxID=224999 RepID=UPI001BD5F2BF|nr:PTS lactose/cellobiose transporter subunit IIA [Tepidanaerobacter syntrophicus]